MFVLQGFVYGVFFLLELATLVALGYWGFQFKGRLLKVLLGIGTPIIVAVFWGTFLAPKASIPVPLPLLILLQAFVFSLATVALFVSEKKMLAIVFASIAVLEIVLMYGFIENK